MNGNVGDPPPAPSGRENLRAKIRGEVRFDDGSRALYATDGSNYREVPIGVVIPRDVEDVSQTILTAKRHGAPILSRGGGTSLAGQCCNVAVVMDMSKYFNQLIEIDPQKRLATVRPGIVLDRVREAAQKHGLTFGPDPATHNHCTIGGMIGNNSCGVHSVMAQFAGTGARTSDNLHELEIFTYDGARMRVGATSEDELESIIRNGGPRGEIYGKLKALAGQIRAAHSRALPENSAARFGLQSGRSFAGERIPRRAGPGRQRRNLRHDPRSDSASDSESQGAFPGRPRLSRCFSRGRSRVPRSCSISQPASKGSTTSWSGS